ncbi:hypothetical protein M0R45_009454 [Rubus argutus]|uniref:Alginate lyase 2 domain-containing protein n=1 Tax=Rubus argutus TaxID=59490 RepID=A0AAW1Y3Q1_RUBAR
MMMSTCSYYKKVLFLLFLSSLLRQFCTAADPTDGFTQVQLTDQNFKLQQPYDKSPAERYININGVEKFWVYTNDKPFMQDSPTRPRTEMRISGYDYTSGVWQFEGNFFCAARQHRCYNNAALTGSSNYMESRWKGIKVFNK